jgi:hypothetical protein
LERRVLASDVPGKMLQALRPAGLVGLGILPGPLRRPLGFAGPLISLADYHGKRIGVHPSTVSEEIFRSLGATAIVQSRGNAVSGLDGVESHVAAISSGLDVPGATLTGNVIIEPRPNVIFMNARAFDALDPQQRSLLAQAEARAQAMVYEPDAGAVQDLCRRRTRIVNATAADLAALRGAVRPVYDSLESDAATRAFIAAISSIRDSIEDAPDVVSCPSSETQHHVTTTVTALDGRWDVSYTRNELMAAGADPSEDLPANYGHFIFTFERGSFSQIGPRPGEVEGAGSYVVINHTITFYRTDHAYPGSDTEVWGPYTWSVYRGTLTFAKAGPGPMPTSPVVKSWRSVGA